MRFTLKSYQLGASADVTKALRRATKYVDDDPSERWAVILSAPTGAGKTVIASSVIETLFDGAGTYGADPFATVLWVTDDPALNIQTARNMMQASSTLGPNRLKTINAGFDAELFDSNTVYFLNIQKLSKGSPLSKSNVDGRQFSLWQTISNTIASIGAHFYVVIDEAHRGSSPYSDRVTIVSRIINGQKDVNPAAPVVWGISATPDRFAKAMASRSTTPITITAEETRSSGLIKDAILLRNPGSGQPQGDTSLIRAAVRRIKEFDGAWAAYGASQGEPLVSPALVVQVQNRISDAELGEIFDAIFGEWVELRDANIVNTFGEHTTISADGHTVAYMAPQDIQDDSDVRVVLCKDAITTGWDCPRAEVLVSLRTAQDYTYIAQLIGRMVRTPLAHRVMTDPLLNVVNCYLPRFNEKQVMQIVESFADGKNDEPPVQVIVNPVVLERNDNIADEVYGLLESLPTYLVPGRVFRTQIARLMSLATLLSGDHILEEAIDQALALMKGVLTTQRAAAESDGTFSAGLDRVRSVQLVESAALLSAETMDDLPDGSEDTIELDDNNIDDLFKVAKRKLPEGLALSYFSDLVEVQGDDDFDPTSAKAEVAVLALTGEVVKAVEASAEHQAGAWLKKYQPSIAKLTDARRAKYEDVRRDARSPELATLDLTPRTVSDSAMRWPKHLLAEASTGLFPTTPSILKGWETQVVQRELADTDLVAWYRNPVGGSATIRIPYESQQTRRPMYPDLVLFHQTDEGLRASLVDPHGYHLADAAAKLRGLAVYAAQHGGSYYRIEAVVETGGQLMALDLKSEAVRQGVATLSDDGVEDFFKTHGGNYN